LLRHKRKVECFVSGHDLIGCGKTLRERQEVSGHDFSRAANAIELTWALAPEAKFLLRYFLFARATTAGGTTLIFIFRNYCRPEARAPAALSKARLYERSGRSESRSDADYISPGDRTRAGCGLLFDGYRQRNRLLRCPGRGDHAHARRGCPLIGRAAASHQQSGA
jgi:hypothetical protein